MTERRNQARGSNEWNEIYGGLGSAPTAQQIDIPIALLDPWTDPDGTPQPFKPYSRKRLEKLASSIRKYGVIEPICIRPHNNGRFQIIAGHNRVDGSVLAGLMTIPAFVRNISDKEARQLMIDSNLLHRSVILPSERMRSYLKIMKDLRHQGKRADLTSDNDCPKLSNGSAKLTSDNDCPKLPDGTRSDQIIASMYNVSTTSVKQYIRLKELLPEMLDMVDNEAQVKEDRDSSIPCMTFVAGYELSFLEETAQALILSAIYTTGKVPSPAQAKKLRQKEKESQLDEDMVLKILRPAKSPKATTIKIPGNRIGGFFPPNTSPDVMEEEIYAALLAYRQSKQPPASA